MKTIYKYQKSDKTKYWYGFKAALNTAENVLSVVKLSGFNIVSVKDIKTKIKNYKKVYLLDDALLTITIIHKVNGDRNCFYSKKNVSYKLETNNIDKYTKFCIEREYLLL